MAKMDKVSKRIMIIGCAVAILAIIAAAVFKIKQQSLISVIAVIWALLVVIRMYLINGKNKEYSQMLDHLSKILTEENDPERYIEMCNNYINKVDDEKFKTMLKVNSAAGYASLGKYDEAASVLKNIDISYLAESHKAILYNNLAQYAFLTGKDEEGLKYVDDNRQLLFKYLKNKNMAATFMITFAFDYYYKENKSIAKKFAQNIIDLIEKSGSTTKNDITVLAKLQELLIKIEELPDDDDYNEDDEFVDAEITEDITTQLEQEADADDDVDTDE